MNMEMARLRPSTAGLTRSPSSSPRAQPTRTASLKTSAPAATDTETWPPNVTCRLVPATVAPENDCSPMVTRPNVTGALPQVLERRTRMVSLQMSGFTIIRSVWLIAWMPVLAGNAKFTSATVCTAPTPLKTLTGAVVQAATHLRSSRSRSSLSLASARAERATSARRLAANRILFSMGIRLSGLCLSRFSPTHDDGQARTA